MNESVGSTIEKIKLLEQDNENKLKEKREYEAIVASLNHTIKETMQQTQKINNENSQLNKKIDCIKAELAVEKTKKNALLAQVELSKKELEDLKKYSDQGIAKVWELRSQFCTAVQTISDECDIRALLIKPMHPEYVTQSSRANQANSSIITKNEERLKHAIEKRNKALSTRLRLQVEPEEGDEFIRIKNALQYSLDMVSSLNK